MPPMYIGGGSSPMPGPMPLGPSLRDAGTYAGGSIDTVKTGRQGRPMPGPAQGGPRGPIFSALPGQTTVPIAGSNVLQPGSVRPSGPSQGFDPQYLQNLATAIGGLFSRPGGNLRFNPLGDLSDVKSPSLGFGNAPSPGLPSTMLQDAINGLAFMFNPPAAPSAGGGAGPVAGGGNGANRNRGGNPIFSQ